MANDLNKSMAIVFAVVIFTIGMIVCAYKVSDSLIEIKGNNSLTVTGSAKQQITSDLIVWQGTFSAQSANMQEAYKILNASQEKVKKYLLTSGVKESEIILTSIYTNPIYEVNYNGMNTNNVLEYKLSQSVEIKSSEVDKITEISRNSTSLINDGVDFQSMMPQYFYTKIADLKISMLAEATKDAKLRAQQIAENTDSEIGNLKSAKMGVFQITPLYSNEISDYGMNDTYSLEKEITSVISCQFELK